MGFDTFANSPPAEAAVDCDPPVPDDDDPISDYSEIPDGPTPGATVGEVIQGTMSAAGCGCDRCCSNPCSCMNCNDGNPCTTDRCFAGICTHDPLTGPCDDQDLCTTNDSCVNGVCVGTPVYCNDNDPCTEDSCEPTNGCIFVRDDCEDFDPCTADICDSATGLCTNEPLTCDDGDVCTDDSCDPATGCVNAPVDCDDEDPCTDDSCDPATGLCVNDPIDCDDNRPCTLDSCNERTGNCVHDPPRECDDLDFCTDDGCDDQTGGCVNTPKDCDDGDPCTLNDYCQNSACHATPDPSCDWAYCPAEHVVDGEGQDEGFPYSRTERTIIPHGTGCVRVLVYYFTREYPEWTGEDSEWNDRVSYEVTNPNGTIASGSGRVNTFHDDYVSGPYPGGNYLVADKIVDFISLAGTGDSWLDTRGTAINISDDLRGSGVAFVIECGLVDMDVESVPEEDEWDPGGFLCVNDDDDNNNGVPDKDETGAVADEDDLLKLTLSVDPELTSGSVELRAISGGWRIRVYLTVA